jgi:para-aminobenzoate synthetase component I
VKRIFKEYRINNIEVFYNNILLWAEEAFETNCFLYSNDYKTDKYGEYSVIIAAGCVREIEVGCENEDAFQLLKKFSDSLNDWLFGFFSYDLKNQTEKLYSKNSDDINFPLLVFFQPEILFIVKDNFLQIGLIEDDTRSQDDIFSQINEFKSVGKSYSKPEINSKTSKEEYLENVSKIKQHIQKGDIYEMNYCIEFFSKNALIDPVESFIQLNKISPSPFAAFFKYNNKYLICSSPERFLKKKSNTITSQPIKGTISRGLNSEEDAILSQRLYNDPKERSENVMIVDLVRNDLSKTAKKDSVKVPELFGIYKFAKVHQMISTVTSEIDEEYHYIDVIKSAFPMGSMTGAPKIRAMQIAEEYETTKRGLYSGSIGYISPEKDFDFNVVIRSVLYNKTKLYLSFMAGSAITSGSIPHMEYEECLLKAQSMASIFNHLLNND